MAEQLFYVGVHAVIANRGRFLALRRAPAMSYAPERWDLPGGHLALGESFQDCLMREVREETGLSIAIERMLGLNAMPSQPYVQAFFACRPAVYQKVALRPNEHTESRWVTVEEARALDLIPYLERVLTNRMLDYVK